MASPNQPTLLSFDGARIPQALKDLKRWSPWKAIWSEKKQKYDKVPYRADAPQYGISTARPERWSPYAQALKAYEKTPGFQGLGFCMTGMKDLVGIDLDKCVDNGVIAPWAMAIVKGVNSYTEFSPSGRGLRIFCIGEIPDDWNNHEIGIEVYAGHDARFLTITGSQVPGTAFDIREPAIVDYLDTLRQDHAREKVKATVEELELPDLIDELALPDTSALVLPDHVERFLTDGDHDGDGSAVLYATGIALYAQGFDDATVFSLLASNEHAMAIALAHRRDDPDRALAYLWRNHCMKAKDRGTGRLATLDDFEDLTEGKGVEAEQASKPMRFDFKQAKEFTNAKPVDWLIKKVLPKAELGVLFGASGAGKTFFTLDLVMAVVMGQPWRDMRVQQGTVAYICAEGAGGFRLRLKAYAEHHGKKLEDLPLYILGGAPNMTNPKDVKDLIKALKAIPNLSLVVVDTWAQVTPGSNENSGEDMGLALANCKAVHAATGAMVLLVAHSGKDESKGVRGWSGVKAALDVEIQVERLTEASRAATITKFKDGEGEGTSYGFHLVSVTLGKDSDGDDITSCVIGFDGEVVRASKAQRLGANEQLVVQALTDLLSMGGVVTSAVLIDNAVEQTPRGLSQRDQRRGKVMQSIKSLVEKGVILIDQGHVTLQENAD